MIFPGEDCIQSDWLEFLDLLHPVSFRKQQEVNYTITIEHSAYQMPMQQKRQSTDWSTLSTHGQTISIQSNKHFFHFLFIQITYYHKYMDNTWYAYMMTLTAMKHVERLIQLLNNLPCWVHPATVLQLHQSFPCACSKQPFHSRSSLSLDISQRNLERWDMPPVSWNHPD